MRPSSPRPDEQAAFRNAIAVAQAALRRLETDQSRTAFAAVDVAIAVLHEMQRSVERRELARRSR